MSRETLRARLAAATPGPWTDDQWDEAYYPCRIGEGGTTIENGRLIAHARQDLPALLALADAVDATRDFAVLVDAESRRSVSIRASDWARITAALVALETLP